MTGIALQFFRPDARHMGSCEQRDCTGHRRLVEDMGDWYEVQCDQCLIREGVGKRVAPVGRREHDGDAFLGAL